MALAAFLAGCAGAGARGAPDLLLLQDGEDGRLLLDPRGRFVNLVLPPTRLRALRTGPWTRFKSQRVTRILYRSFRDDFDIVIMAFAEDVALAGVGGWSELASLPVDGLGHPRGGRTGPVGSEGRLRSAIMLGNHPWLVRGPSLHEIAHAWGQWIVDRPQGGHWGFAGVGGQLGGWAPGTLEEVADGQWLAPADAPASVRTTASVRPTASPPTWSATSVSTIAPASVGPNPPFSSRHPPSRSLTIHPASAAPSIPLKPSKFREDRTLRRNITARFAALGLAAGARFRGPEVIGKGTERSGAPRRTETAPTEGSGGRPGPPASRYSRSVNP